MLIELLFAIRGLASAPGRSVYVVMTLALASFSWLVLSVLAAPFLPMTTSTERAQVTVSVTAANRDQDLPLRYARRLTDLDGVDGLIYSTIALVSCGQNAPSVSIQAFGGSRQALLAWSDLWPEASQEMRDIQKRWFDDPMGVLLGSNTAEECQWRPGRSVSPINLFTREPLAMNIAGVRPPDKNPIANVVAYGHYEYFNQAAVPKHRKDTVQGIIVLPAEPQRVNQLAAKIEQEFAYDDPPVNAGTDATMQNALARYGQAQYALGGVMIATLLCTVLVMTSVLAHSIAERRASLALLLVLGFARGALWRAFVLETLAMLIVGGVVGILCALLLLANLPETMALFFSGFRIPEWAWWGLPAILALVALVALCAPTLAFGRLRTDDLGVL